MNVDQLLREGRFLVTQSFLYSYGGSEVITLELVEQLAAGGATVAVATHGYGDVLAGEVRAAGGRLLRLGEPELDEFLANGVDVAWVHQQLVPEPLLRAPEKTVFVFNHMSSFHPLEFPWSPRIERALAAVVAFPAEESREAQVASGLLEGFDPDQLVVLGNPAPDVFLEAQHPLSDELSRVLVVSNHVPDELVVAMATLRDRGVVVDMVGLEAEKGGVPQRIRPESFAGVDAVITIGKTVQFALAAGTPVYCYDHFGGPGWLSEDNIEVARWHNFSGRGFERRAAEEIVEEVVAGYSTARASTAALRDRVGDRLRWSSALRGVLERALAFAGAASTADTQDVEAHLRTQASLGTFMVMAFELDAARRWLVGQNAGLTEAVTELRAGDERLRAEVARLGSANAELSVAAAREAEVAAAFREARAWAAKAEADVTELRAALAEVEARAEDAETAVGRARTEARELQSRVAAITAELEAVRAERDGLAATRAVRLARALRRPRGVRS